MVIKLPINIADLFTRRLADLQAGKAVSRRYRNRRIGEFLKELDLTEGRSTGLPKIFRKMAQNGSPKPIFETEEDRSYFLVRLPVNEAFHQSATLDGEVTPEVTEQVNQKAQSEAQSIKILQIVATLEAMSAKEIANELGLSNKTGAFKRSLQSLIQEGLLAYELPDKPNSRLQKYRLTDLGKQVLAAKDKHS